MAAPDCRLGVRAVDTLTGHVGDVYALAPPPKKNDSRRVLLSGGEDGARLWDLKARACVMQLGAGWLEEVATVALSPSDTNAAFAASDGAIRIFDVRKPDEAVSTVEINSDDINQVALNHKGEYLAAADDSGEVKVVEVWNRKPFKTLGRQHTNICSSVQFRAGKPWEVVTGGLDGCVVHWDFSRARCLAKINMTAAKTPEDAAEIDIGKQMCNPPLVHSLACSPDGSCIAAALGDGSVATFGFGKNGKGALQITNTLEDGHSSSVSQVAFGKLGSGSGEMEALVSGGNDKTICVWDRNKAAAAAERPDGSGNEGVLRAKLAHTAKVNWLTCAPDGLLYVADTSSTIHCLTL